jgi:hypothetical protein
MIRLGVQSYPNWLGFLASVWLETEVTDRISANIRLSNSTVKGELTTLGDCNTSDLVDLERMTVWGAIIRYALEKPCLPTRAVTTTSNGPSWSRTTAGR